MDRFTALFLCGALASAAPASAGKPMATDCTRDARQGMQQCMQDAREQCRAKFQSAFTACFGDQAPCATQCQNAQAKCQSGPSTTQVTCQRACGDRLTLALRECAKGEDATREACLDTARGDGLKCRQQCVTEAAAPIQQCSGTFADCLKRCAAELEKGPPDTAAHGPAAATAPDDTKKPKAKE